MFQRFKNYLLKHLYPTVDPNHFVSFVEKKGSPTIVKLAGQQISDVELRNLQAEIKTLKTFRIWSIFQNTIGEYARQVMFERSKDFEDMKSGKLMLYNLEVLRDIIKKIEDAKRHG